MTPNTFTKGLRRKSWDQYFMELALAASSRATCPKKHVGAILIDKDNHIISTGYNGSPSKEPHCDDVGCLQVNGRCVRTIHAEDNALRRSTWWKNRGSKLYITDFPCWECAHMIARKGVVEVIYLRTLKRPIEDILALFEEEGIVIRRLLIPDSSAVERDPVKVDVPGSSPGLGVEH